LRKAEFNFSRHDLDKLGKTVATYSSPSIFEALENTIELYQELSDRLYPEAISRNTEIKAKTLDYLQKIKKEKLG